MDALKAGDNAKFSQEYEVSHGVRVGRAGFVFVRNMLRSGAHGMVVTVENTFCLRMRPID